MSDPDLAATLALAEAACDVVRIALAQRALCQPIPYRVWICLAEQQRNWIGPLSDRKAIRVLECSECCAELSDPSGPPAWRCSSCGRDWSAP